MKHPLLIAAALSALSLAACTPLGLYYKVGTPVAIADRALINCRVMAENKVPARIVTRVIHGPPLPPRRVCDASGCRLLPPRRLPPQIVSEDANTQLRKEVVAQCMDARGYTHVRIPYCPANLANTVKPQQTTVMPRLHDTSCVIRGRNGVWQIVTPQIVAPE